jgi:CRP-like cAMP-binding protein
MAVGNQLFEKYGRSFPKGTVIFQENDPGAEMFIIQSGKVKISKKVRDVEKTLVILGKGDFFGEMSILNNKPRSATAEVIEDAKLLVIDAKTFEVMVRSNTEIAVRIIKNLSARLQEADNQIENLLIKDNTSRVVNSLAKMAATHGVETAEGVRIDFNFTSDELASTAGLSREQTQEIINKLVKARIIGIKDNQIIISSREQLNKFSKFLEMKEQFGDLA